MPQNTKGGAQPALQNVSCHLWATLLLCSEAHPALDVTCCHFVEDLPDKKKSKSSFQCTIIKYNCSTMGPTSNHNSHIWTMRGGDREAPCCSHTVLQHSDDMTDTRNRGDEVTERGQHKQKHRKTVHGTVQICQDFHPLYNSSLFYPLWKPEI